MPFVVNGFQNAFAQLPRASPSTSSHFETDKGPGKKEKHHMARKLLKASNSPEFVADITSLPLSEVNALEESLLENTES